LSHFFKNKSNLFHYSCVICPLFLLLWALRSQINLKHHLSYLFIRVYGRMTQMEEGKKERTKTVNQIQFYDLKTNFKALGYKQDQ